MAFARRAGPALLWFATLGGAVAWSIHLLVGWQVVEVVACAPGSGSGRQLLGLSLTTLLAGVTAILGTIALTAGLLAWRLRRRVLSPAAVARLGEPRAGRVAFMAEIGLWANLLAVLMIGLGGAALPVLAGCRT